MQDERFRAQQARLGETVEKEAPSPPPAEESETPSMPSSARGTDAGDNGSAPEAIVPRRPELEELGRHGFTWLFRAIGRIEAFVMSRLGRRTNVERWELDGEEQATLAKAAAPVAARRLGNAARYVPAHVGLYCALIETVARRYTKYECITEPVYGSSPDSKGAEGGSAVAAGGADARAEQVREDESRQSYDAGLRAAESTNPCAGDEPEAPSGDRASGDAGLPGAGEALAEAVPDAREGESAE